MSTIEKINLNSNEFNIKDVSYTTFIFEYENYTIAANSSHTFTPTNTLPNNYLETGVLGCSFEGSGCVIAGFGASGSVTLRNETSASQVVKPILTVRVHIN